MNARVSNEYFQNTDAMRNNVLFPPRWTVKLHVAEQASFDGVRRWLSLLWNQLIRVG